MSLSKSIWHETSGRMLSAFPPHPIFTAFLGAVYNSPYPPPPLKIKKKSTFDTNKKKGKKKNLIYNSPHPQHCSSSLLP